MLNIQELREVLSSQIEKLQNDTTTSGKANAVTNACGKILSSIKLEMEYYKTIGRAKAIKFLDFEPATEKTESPDPSQ